MISFILKPVFHNRFIPRFIKKIIDNSIGIIDPKFIRVLPDHIIYEYPTPLIMSWIIKEGDVVIDIGANDGVYTIFLSKLVGKTGKVYAFEPDPRSFSILRHKTKKIQNIIIENKAVSDKNGKLRLYLHERTEATSAFDKNKSIFSIEVECTSLDEYFKDIINNIALIKMDVQGAEFSILRGAKNLLKRVKAIIFEFDLSLIRLANEDPKDLLNFLISNGFILFDLGILGKEIKRINNIKDFLNENIGKQKYTIILAIKL